MSRRRWELFLFLLKYKWFTILCYFSVQFSHSVVSNSLWPHESQHPGPPCPSPTPRGHSNSRPSSWWCHPAISSSVIPFSSCPQSLPASVFSNESTLLREDLKSWIRNSRVIQWSGLGTFTVMAQVKPLVRKLRSYKLSSTTKKKKNHGFTISCIFLTCFCVFAFVIFLKLWQEH